MCGSYYCAFKTYSKLSMRQSNFQLETRVLWKWQKIIDEVRTIGSRSLFSTRCQFVHTIVAFQLRGGTNLIQLASAFTQSGLSRYHQSRTEASKARRSCAILQRLSHSPFSIEKSWLQVYLDRGCLHLQIASSSSAPRAGRHLQKPDHTNGAPFAQAENSD